ncbi:MAG: hypothetical protein ACD_58C00131G0020 [uncultured bacterium]|nr:MAG: hypothetical protein ACD_58C00131G0020 [uncultured bacterium]
MSKKQIITLLLIILILVLGYIAIYILNARGYIKIFGSTNYYQKIESIESYNDWQNATSYSGLDYDGGVLKLKVSNTQAQTEQQQVNQYLNKAQGAQGNNYSVVLDNKSIYFESTTNRVAITNFDLDDVGYVEVNGNRVIDLYQYPGWCWDMNQPENTRILRKCMGSYGGCPSQAGYIGTVDITSYLHLPGSNTFKIYAKDWCGGNVGYSVQLTEYKNITTPASVSYTKSGNYISKIIGGEDLSSFDKLVVSGENKPANTDVYYQFRFSNTPNFDPTEVYKCASNTIGIKTANACVETKYYPTNGEIDLKSIASRTNAKYMAVKIFLTSSDGANSSSLDGFKVYYTTKEEVVPPPQYKLDFNLSYQSKSKTQSKLVKFKVTDSNKIPKQSFDSTLDENNKGSYLLVLNISGSLKIFAKGMKHLSKKIDKTINADSQLDYGQLLAGDMNNDDTVNSLDWSLMNKYWQTTQPDYELTGDDIVNSLDWSIMNSNWGKRGEALTDNLNF